MDHPGREREVIVLHEDDRIGPLDLLADGLCEPPVHALVLQPVRRAELRPRVRVVTERPEALVREPVVVAPLLLLREPHPPERVRLLAGRNPHPVVPVHRLAVCRAAAVRDPRPGARAHHRLERGDEAARRVDDADRSVRPALVHVRLPVRDDHDAVAVKVLAKDVLEPRRRPRRDGRPALRREVRDEAPHVREQRLEGVSRAQLRVAAPPARQQQDAAKLVRPAPPPGAAHEHREDGGEERDEPERREGEVPHRELAPRHEAQIVDEDERTANRLVVLDPVDADVYAPAVDLVGKVQLGREHPLRGPGPQRLARELFRKGLRAAHRDERRRADLHGHDPLVAGEILEQRCDLATIPAAEMPREGALRSDRRKPRAQRDVAHEPRLRGLVHRKGGTPGQHGEPEEQGHRKSPDRSHGGMVGDVNFDAQLAEFAWLGGTTRITYTAPHQGRRTQPR